MSMIAITEDEILAILEEHPAGLDLEDLAGLGNKRFPAGVMGRLFDEGKVVTVDYNEHRKRYSIWGYRYRLSAAEWLRRQKLPSGG